jgi:hypothetical protein
MGATGLGRVCLPVRGLGWPRLGSLKVQRFTINVLFMNLEKLLMLFLFLASQRVYSGQSTVPSPQLVVVAVNTLDSGVLQPSLVTAAGETWQSL